MNISILETGKLPKTLERRFGNYTSMFFNLLNQLEITHTLKTYEVTKNQFPIDLKSTDLWVITGSSYGVYDNLPWILALKDLLNQIMTKKIPVLGICFGHQILAETMGGKVEKSSKGWGVGVHTYYRNDKTLWTKRLGHSFSGYASHQDQVIVAPKTSIPIYGSKFCPNSILTYGDKENPNAISIQSHPEFSKDCLKAIINRKIGKAIPRSVGKNALQTLKVEPNNLKVFRTLLEAINII